MNEVYNELLCYYNFPENLKCFQTKTVKSCIYHYIMGHAL